MRGTVAEAARPQELACGCWVWAQAAWAQADGSTAPPPGRERRRRSSGVGRAAWTQRPASWAGRQPWRHQEGTCNMLHHEPHGSRRKGASSSRETSAAAMRISASTPSISHG